MRLLPLVALALATTATAAPPSLTQQGRLMDASGLALTGDHDLHFGLWDAPSGGQSLWAEDQLGVAFDGGYYVVDLGIQTPLDPALFQQDALWLSLSVDDGPALPTRIPLASVPYALAAHQVVGGPVSATEVRVGGTLVIASDGTVGWDRITGAPSVLGALGCGPGEHAQATDTGWTCAAANAHTHDADQIVSGTLSTTVLPVGTSPDTVAAGNHVHDIATLSGTLTAAQAANLLPADIGAASSAELAAAVDQANAAIATATDVALAAITEATNNTNAAIASASATAAANLNTAKAESAALVQAAAAQAQADLAAEAALAQQNLTAAVTAVRSELQTGLAQAASDLATHQADPGAHHARYTDVEAAAAAAVALSAHGAVPDAHHTPYTDAQAIAAAKANLTLADLGSGTVLLATDTSPSCTQAGLLRYNNGVEFCDGTAWFGLRVAMPPGSGQSADSAAASCKELLANYPGTPSGFYWVNPLQDPANAWETFCDMTLDGGGWTLVAYAGDNSAGFPRMDVNTGVWNPSVRTGKASHGAVQMVRGATEMALAYYPALNSTLDLEQSSDTVSFTIPSPSVVSFTTATNAGSCVAVAARRLRPASSNAACVGATGTPANSVATNAAANCNPSGGAYTAGVWTQSLGGTYAGVFAYGLYTTQYSCNSWPDISHHWWVDSAYHNWEPSATQPWPGNVNGSTAIWLR